MRARPVSGGSLTLWPERRRRSGKGGCPIRWRSVWLTACSGALAVALAGCGGTDEAAETEAQGPRIESAIANELAAISEEIADRLESGDRCGAAESAARLRDDVTAAINDGKVPTVYLEDLSGLANELTFEVQPCAEPAAPPEEDEDDDDESKGKKKGEDKKDKDDNDDDDDEVTVPTVTEPTETFPEETTTDETTTEQTTTEQTTTEQTTTETTG
jgi:hypothetical protein